VSPSLAARRIRVDRLALRRALGGRAEIVEAEAAVKAAGRLQVNAGRMWQFMTTSVYQSGDLPVLATREALQNGIDAIRAAVRARQIGARDGRFAVTWDAESRRLSWDDNGIGMDAETVLTKFLSLGDSGKRSAASSEDAAGGFGVAKAVILGTSETFRWTMLTRDNRVVSTSADAEVQVFDAPSRQGTILTVEDVPARFERVWDRARSEYVSLIDRLRELLATNDLPDVALVLNGEPVVPLFSRRGGSKVASGSWGAETTGVVKAYRRLPGDRRGAYYLRLGGLFQYKLPSYRGNLKADVVIDLVTTLRPGDDGYPFNAGRDALLHPASTTLSDLIDEVEKENESVARDKEFEVYDPESEDDEERQGADELANLAAEALRDPTVQGALARALGGIAEFYGEQLRRPGVSPKVESAAPAGTKVRVDGPERAPVLPPGFTPRSGPSSARSPAVASELSTALEAVAPVTPAVRTALANATAGYLDDSDIRVIEEAVDRATEAATQPGGGGLIQVAPIVAHAAAVLAMAPAREDRRRNPFGHLAGLRISKKHYDRAKAYRFRKSFARWMQHLIAWDATLRLIAREAQIHRQFKPGFVLDDQVVGLTAKSPGSKAVVYIHPDRFAAVIRAHRTRPLGVAAFLHGVAVHELTHLDGRMGDGHDESFVTAREDLGEATGHLLEGIAVLAQRLLGLAETPDQARIGKLERELARDGKRRADVEAQLRKARRELAAAQAASASIARECSHECGNCRRLPGFEPHEELPPELAAALVLDPE